MRHQSAGAHHSIYRIAALVAAGVASATGVTFADITPAGSASDTRLAIQNAIDAAATATVPGTVTLGNGTFEIDAQLMVTGGVTLVGQGWENTIIKQTANGQRVASLKDGSTLRGVTVTGGKLTGTWQHGAGLNVEKGTVSWCKIFKNKSTATHNVWGAGVHIASGTIDHSIVASNELASITSGGGGIGTYNTSGNIVIDTCLVYGNVANGSDNQSRGGGICFYGGAPTVLVRNTTITGNSASGTGGGFCNSTSGNAMTFVNTIVFGNTAETDNDVHGTLASGSSNNLVGVDPLFLNAEGNDYHIDVESPAVRAGVTYEGVGNDLDGNAFAATPSIGCYEYIGELMVVRPVFTPAPGVTFTPSLTVSLSCPTEGATIRYTTDGSDPTDTSNIYSAPFNISATTIIKARAYKSGMLPSKIVTAEYTHGPSTSPALGTVTVEPSATVAVISADIDSVGNNLASSCEVYLALGTDYGSYGAATLIASKAVDSFSYVIPGLAPERTYYYELTVVNNAQIPQAITTSGNFTTTAKAALKPVAGDAAATRARIQEAIDMASLESPAGTVVLAGDLFEIDTQLMVTGGVTLVGQGWDNTVVKQTAGTVGAGTRVMTVDDGARVKDLAITGGKVTGANYQYGGGVLIMDGTVSWCCVTNNTVYGNNTKYGGGVAFGDGGKGQLDHCVIKDNIASTAFGTEVGGGGIGVYKPSGAVTVDSCLVSGNSSVYTAGHVGYGGGIGVAFWQSSNTVTIRNTTIVGNVAGEDGTEAASEGGAVYTKEDTKSKFSMVNCIIAYNTTMNNSTTVKLNYAGDVNYCFFDVADDVLGANSKTGDPVFYNVEKGNFRLRAKSPCIDAGYKGDWMTNGSLALDSNPRIMGRGPDMGCYETSHSGFTIRLR